MIRTTVPPIFETCAAKARDEICKMTKSATTSCFNYERAPLLLQHISLHPADELHWSSGVGSIGLACEHLRLRSVQHAVASFKVDVRLCSQQHCTCLYSH